MVTMLDFLPELFPEDWTSAAANLPNAAWYPVLIFLCALSGGPLVIAIKLWWRYKRRWLLYTGIGTFLAGCGISASLRPLVAGLWDRGIAAMDTMPSIESLGADALSSIVGWISGAAGALFVWFFLWALMEDGK